MANQQKSNLLKTEAGCGLILAIAAALGMIAANSPLSSQYFAFLHAEIPLQIGSWVETHDVLDWIKEGLLAVFFFMVGLEIKFEALKGELSSPKRLALPLFSAAGGMLVPAGVYLALNVLPGGRPEGWPIPMATDIVFAMAALAAVGARAPPSLRAFLLALAVVDDLGAVILIALLFSDELDLLMIGGSVAVIAAMAAASLFWKRAPPLIYAIGAVAVWAFSLKSGVATSVGAVAAALTVPVAQHRPGQHGMAHDMMESLRPYVSYGVLPIFAFAASGFAFSTLGAGDLVSPVMLGVLLGLVIGKPVGVFGACWLAVRLELAQKPAGANWRQVFGASILCGVGFTMSLYIASLAFADASEASTAARLGVILASVVATGAGVFFLLSGPAPDPPRRRRPAEALLAAAVPPANPDRS